LLETRAYLHGRAGAQAIPKGKQTAFRAKA
jgi:hypothetical protein